MPLTVKAIEALKPIAGRRQEIPDKDGLYLIVQPSGLKSWAFRYRSPTNPEKAKKLTIGSAEDIDLGGARLAASDARRQIRQGIDPAETARIAKAKARDRSSLTGEFFDAYLAEYMTSHKPSSYAEAKRLIDKWARHDIGDRRIEEVTRRDVEGILAKMRKAGAPISANRLLAVLKPFFAWVRIGDEPLPSLPTADVARPASEKGRDRDRVLTDAEIAWLWLATDDRSAFSAAVRLMLLTGQRRGEVAGMLSTELDLKADAPTWLLPAARTKNGRENLVPLTATAVEAINRPPHVGRTKLVLTSATGTELSGWSKCKTALDARMLAIATKLTGRPPNMEPWVLHDLRRTCATGMSALGEPPHVVEAVLNHKTGQITKLAGIYNRHAYAGEKRGALAKWADHVAKLAGLADG